MSAAIGSDASPMDLRVPKVYTVSEAAKLLRVGRDFLYGEVKAKRITHYRVGRRVLIPDTALNEWVFRRSEGGAP